MPSLLLSRILDTIGYRILFLSNKVKPIPQQNNDYHCWYTQSGQYLRIDYTLDSNSVVFDLGGNQGDWTASIASNYCCNIYVFEPVFEFYQHLQKRFSHNNKIKIFHFGLAERTTQLPISVNNDASTIFREVGPSKQTITLKRAFDFFKEHGIEQIDLMKINIEGGEYDLLEHLIDTNFIAHISNIQIQFHDFIPDAESRMENIQSMLRKSHHLTYQFRFGFENWEKNI